MNADEFAEKLWALAPTIKEMREAGLTIEECERMRDTHRALPKGIHELAHADPLVDLVLRYDVTRIEVGSIQFGELRSDEIGLCVGQDESDHLYVSRLTGEVFVMEFGSQNCVICECALNGASFLDGLIRATESCWECPWNLESEDGPDPAWEAAAECTKLAGGEKYATFWKTLAGAW